MTAKDFETDERDVEPGKDAAAYYDSGCLRGVHLTLGKDYALVIERVTSVRIKFATETKKQIKLYFNARHLAHYELEPLPLYLNPTNRDSIARLHGPDASQWKGKAIALYRDKTDFGRQRDIPCIRIRPQIPQSKKGKPNDRATQAPATPATAAPDRALSDADVDALRRRAEAARPGAIRDAAGAGHAAQGGAPQDDAAATESEAAPDAEAGADPAEAWARE
jgi:hypothetical protein